MDDTIAGLVVVDVLAVLLGRILLLLGEQRRRVIASELAFPGDGVVVVWYAWSEPVQQECTSV